MPFKSGISGNPNGRPRTKMFTEALVRHLHIGENQKGGGKKDTKLDAITKMLIKKAQEGEIAAIKEIAERVEGKSDASVSVQHSGSIAHEHEPISDTLSWLKDVTGKDTPSPAAEPVLH